MMGHRYRTRTGDELDLITRVCKTLCFMARPGVCRRIKAQISRRIRREAKQEMAREQES